MEESTGDLIMKSFRQYDYIEYAWNISFCIQD